MNAVSLPTRVRASADSLHEALDRGCSTFAPAWPLDQLIAVNPWWGMRHQPIAEVAARIGTLGQARGLMPRNYYAAQWQRTIEAHHLRRAALELGAPTDVEPLLRHLAEPEPRRFWHNVSEFVDGVTRPGGRAVLWADEIVHQISQFCAATFQLDSLLHPANLPPGELYRRWLAATRADRGLDVLMGEPVAARFAALPEDHRLLLSEAAAALGIEPAAAADYAQALLLDLNGWASWVAYLRWQDGLDGADNGLMSELLAIRMAWELVLWQHLEIRDAARFSQVRRLWQRQLRNRPALLADHRDGQRLTWVWQRAAELAYQDQLHRALRRRPAAPTAPPQVRLQAAFCIDVRSEVMRRALEAQDPGIVTLGFAGFFGLPIEYGPAGTEFTRPQLPGLLKPSIRVTEADPRVGRPAPGAGTRLAWLTEAPPATFSLVEATGLGYAFKLLKDALFPGSHRHPINGLRRGGGWRLERDGAPLATEDLAGLAAGILGAMGLTRGFAPTVLLVGHGSTSRNNPHAAGLDCGACGGQTGEINARVLAMLLNDADVRTALRDHGVDVPQATRFVAALHDTTTDEIRCFDADPAELRLVEPRLAEWLAGAGVRARRERSGQLGLAALDDRALAAACRRRARDWSQVRPEWGLAGNAAFIVAPRERTQQLDLSGRAFLHDYRWREDPGFAVLELIMTAPMLVTHWINMQYFASTTDNRKYGSGNKVLHNVVGGNLGVFEGNGGDLRIGLPLQSLHDGERWMHEPLRLSVYLAAPRTAIAGIAARHQVVAELIDNEWLFLFRIADDGTTIERLRRGQWAVLEREASLEEDSSTAGDMMS